MMTKAEVQRVAVEVSDRFADRLPCRKNTEMIVNHETILKNGLQATVKNLDDTLKEYIKEQRDLRETALNLKRKAWLGFVAGTATMMLGILIGWLFTTII